MESCPRRLADVPTAVAIFAPERLRVYAKERLRKKWSGGITQAVRRREMGSNSGLPFGGLELLDWMHYLDGSIYRDLREQAEARGKNVAAIEYHSKDSRTAPDLSFRDTFQEAVTFAEVVSRRRIRLRPGERQLLEIELAERAGRWLVASHVSFRAELRGDGEMRLVILPTGPHRMNVWAANAPRGQGRLRGDDAMPGTQMTVTYSPRRAGSWSIGTYFGAGNQLALGPKQMLLLDPETFVNRHENRHGVNENDETRRLGWSTADEGYRLPLLTGSYFDTQGHDETDTYMHGVLLTLDTIRRELRRRRLDFQKLGEAFDNLELFIGAGDECSIRDMRIALESYGALVGGAMPRIVQDVNGWRADVRVEKGPVRYWSHFPLADSPGPADPYLVPRTQARIGRLYDVAANNANQFALAKHVFERFGEVRDRYEMIAMVEALYGACRTWSAANLRTVSLPEVFERYDRLLDFHYERVYQTATFHNSPLYFN